MLDFRAMMHYVGTGITPAMTRAGVGIGSQYAYTAEDANGAALDGGKHYTLTLPAGIPVKTFWAIDIYDTQTRSLLQTDNPYPSVNNRFGDLHTEDNGDVIIRFGPTPAGGPANYLQTIAGKSWFPILRLYGPLATLVRPDLAPQRSPTRLTAALPSVRCTIDTVGPMHDRHRDEASDPAHRWTHDRIRNSARPRSTSARTNRPQHHRRRQINDLTTAVTQLTGFEGIAG